MKMFRNKKRKKIMNEKKINIEGEDEVKQQAETSEEKITDPETAETEKAEETEESPQAEEAEQPAEAEEKDPLEAAQEEIAKLKEQMLYKAAEFDNYRRRVSQEKLDLIDTAAKGVINELLPVVDNFERALKALEESEATDAAKTGTELIYKQLLDVLKKKGVTEIEAMGKELDTDEQEAVAQIPAPDEGQKGKVVDVIQKGYKLNGKGIRFAKVVIGI